MHADTSDVWALLDLDEIRKLRTPDEFRAHSLATLIRHMHAPQHDFWLWSDDVDPPSHTAWTARSRSFLRALKKVAEATGEEYLLGVLPDDYTPGVRGLRLKARTGSSRWKQGAFSRFPLNAKVHHVDATGVRRIDLRTFASSRPKAAEELERQTGEPNPHGSRQGLRADDRGAPVSVLR